MKKPIIGISGSELTKNVGPFVGYRRSYVNKDYSEAVIKNGGVPMIIPFNEDADVTESQLELVDTLILSGGQDIDSESYGEEPQPEQGTVWQARDQFDMRLLKLAEKRGIPVLGICRGHQVINVGLGGTLQQHIGDVLCRFNRRVPTDSGDKVHAVYSAEGSWYRQTYGEEFCVNSAHHQRIDRLGQHLKIIQRCPDDGCPEALEHDELPILGLQWHPERLPEQAGEPLLSLLSSYF